jgi:uncharacterized protein
MSDAHPPWPHRLLDVPALRSAGYQPHPFRVYVVKVHSRCNLACEYCYVYEMADKGWRHQPLAMRQPTAEQCIARIAEHVRTHGIRAVKVALHGGEPLLAGAPFIEEFARMLRSVLPSWVRADLVIQTNGTRLDRPMLDVLLRNQIRVGVSLDGGRAATDRYRRYPNGRGSHEAVIRALALLQSEPYRKIYAGLLCTVCLENDPVDTYEALLAHAPPMIDFLLPHGTWSTPPPSRRPDSSTPYADWLLRVFRRWVEADRPETSIRLFESIIALCLGSTSTTETVGLAPTETIVIDTDGSIKQIDALYSVYDGAADTGLNVAEHPLDAVLDHPTTVARQIGVHALSRECHACVVRDICGGGYYPHRYRAGEGFRNPSVYCRDLLRVITAIRGYVSGEVARLVRAT